jgi:predicted HicB family RNase H-like nuclease
MDTKPLFVSRFLRLAAVVLFLAAAVSAQSLGELARQERARKPQPVKPARVFTNDNLPHEGGLTTSDTGSESKAKPGDKTKEGEAKEGEAKEGAGKEAAKKGEGGEAAKTSAEAEKEYREKSSKLRDALALEEKKLDVLQREFNLSSTQYYSDPNKAMNEQYARTELNNRQAEIDKQKAAVDAAKQAVSNLEDELRKKNLPPGWGR